MKTDKAIAYYQGLFIRLWKLIFRVDLFAAALSGRFAASSGLRLPASASCLERHSRLAGRCPNSSSLYRPQAAVIAVAPKGRATGGPVMALLVEQSLRSAGTTVLRCLDSRVLTWVYFGKHLLPMRTGPGALRHIGPKRTAGLARPANASPSGRGGNASALTERARTLMVSGC